MSGSSDLNDNYLEAESDISRDFVEISVKKTKVN